MVTYKLLIEENDIWFVQNVIDTAENICLVDKTTMKGNVGLMLVHVMDEQEDDFVYLLEKLAPSSRFKYERLHANQNF